MPDHEVIAQRHEFRSPESDREEFVKTAKEGAAAAGLGRRSLIKRSLWTLTLVSLDSPRFFFSVILGPTTWR
jgi:ubiquinol-cytochrome c reductase iron-sulfur subunit